jgi:hypothetical protein
MGLHTARLEVLDEGIEILSSHGEGVMRKFGVGARPPALLLRETDDCSSHTDLSKAWVAVQDHFTAENLGVKTFGLLQVPHRDACVVETAHIRPIKLRHDLFLPIQFSPVELIQYLDSAGQ